MKKIYFNLMEVGNGDCPNMGVVETYMDKEFNLSDDSIDRKVKECIESHMDAEVVDMSKIDVMEAHQACGVEFEVTIDNNGEIEKIKVEVEQTWLYS